MIDLMVAVENATQWHEQNIQSNPHHYTQVQKLGASAISQVQRAGGGVYFNTILEGFGGRGFKYGVVSMDDLLRDLTEWNCIYVSGRLHKPVRHLVQAPQKVVHALQTNLESAAAAALLSLPERFTEEQLYAAIAHLSYTRDIRTLVRAEAPTKVSDIVKANVDGFRSLYAPCESVRELIRTRGGVWRRGIDTSAQARLFARVPETVRWRVARLLRVDDHDVPQVDTRRVAAATVASVGCIVAKSSLRQAVKGLLTAGFGTSLRYVGAKIKKGLSGTLLPR